MTNAQIDRNFAIERAYRDCGDVPIWKALMLADMAAHDVWPDGRFSDDDCLLWSKFHHIYEQGGLTDMDLV